MASRLAQLCGHSEAWHRTRRESIGSSDAKIIMEGKPDLLIQLWREKRGEAEPEDLSRNIPVCVGTVTEALNLALFEDETGLVVTRDGEQVRHPEFPFMGCTLDGWVASERAVVEGKHVGGREAFEAVVSRYMPQTHHLVAVTQAVKAYLSVIIGNSEYRVQEIEPDPFYLAELIEREHAFWLCVQTGTPPAALPPVAPPAIPTKIVDMAGSNSWAVNAATWLETREPAKRFNDAVKGLKELIEPDVKLATGHGICARRDGRGVTIGALQ